MVMSTTGSPAAKPSPRAEVIQETLSLLGADSPWLREQVETVVDELPHIFRYTSEKRPWMVRYHVLRRLGIFDELQAL